VLSNGPGPRWLLPTQSVSRHVLRDRLRLVRSEALENLNTAKAFRPQLPTRAARHRRRGDRVAQCNLLHLLTAAFGTERRICILITDRRFWSEADMSGALAACNPMRPTAFRLLSGQLLPHEGFYQGERTVRICPWHIDEVVGSAGKQL
jgi:hypothetical protein